MTTYESWKAEAMRLAWQCEEFAISEFKSVATEDDLRAARAALSLHLLAYPVGEPVGYVFAPDLELLRDEPSILLTVLRDSSEPSQPGFVTPLYRNPKESA